MLRVAIAHSGRIIDERLVKHRQDVTIGEADDCTFFAELGDRRSFALFEYRNGRWELHVLDGMTGALDSGDGARELGLHRTHRNLDGTWSIPLGDKARGKIAVGRAVVLFQLVDPPASVARPQLPMSVLHRTQIDWPFTIIAAFSFAAHYGVLGVMTSDWVTADVDDASYIAYVVDAVAALPNVPPPPDERAYEPTEGSELSTMPAQAPTQGTKGGAPGPGPGPQTPRTGMSKAERASLLNELESIDMQISGVVGGSGPATERVLRPGEHPSGDLDAIARSAAGSGRPGSSGLNFGGSSGRVTPGLENGFAPLPGIPSAGPTSSAAETRPPPPAPVPTVGGQPQATCQIKNVQAAVASMRPAFRQCYMRVGLSVNPEMEGGVMVTALVGPNGDVQSVVASPSGSISPAVASCVAGRVRSTQFEPPECGTATVVIPVWLKHQ